MFIEALTELRASDPDKADELYSKYQKQRLHFFNRRMVELTDLYELTDKDKKDIWGALLTAEQPLSVSGTHITTWLLPNFEDLKSKDELIDDTLESQSFFGLVKMYWSQAWREFAEMNKISLVARYVLKSQKDKGKDKSAHIISAERELIAELNISLPKAYKSFALAIDQHSVRRVDENGIMELDKEALNYFKQYNIGSASKATVRHLKTLIDSKNYNLEKRQKFWSNPLFFEKMVALCRWHDRMKKYVNNIQEKPAALTSPIFLQLTESLKKDICLGKDGVTLENAAGMSLMKFNPSACMQVPTAESILRARIPLLSSIITHRMIRCFVIEAHKQYTLGVKEPHKLIIDGGYEGLCELIGMVTTNENLKKIRQIIQLLTACTYKYEDKHQIAEGNLFSYHHWQAKGRKASKLAISMESFACPGFVEELPMGGTKNQRQRQLMPIVTMPSFVGRPNDHSAQACFQMELIIEMRLRAKEIYERGGILLNEEDKLNLAEKARMPKKLIPKVLECWTAEDYLEEVDDFVYNLGPRYSEAQSMLFTAGKKEVEGALAGKIQKKKSGKRFKPAG